MTVVLSVGIHAGVAASMAFGHGGSAPGRPVEAFEVEIAPPDAPPVPTPVVEEGPKDAPTPAAAPHPHVHPYPVAASHDSTPHPADAEHHPADHAGADHDHEAPAAPAAPAAPEVASSPAPMPRFTMALGGAGGGATVAPSAGGGNGAAGGSTAAPAAAPSAPLPEASVTTRARLLTSVKAAYPLDARTQEIEADVPLDIVLDVDGRVLEARAAKNPGYGFDRAAVDAVLRYRFAPAQKDGQPVRVRMRWVVQFRLE